MSWWNELPVVGGLAGSIFGNPEQEAHQKAMEEASKRMMAYRPDAMTARMNVMGNMSHAFDPMNNMMGQMYGQGAMMNMDKTIQNPFPKQMQEGMMNDAFNPEVKVPGSVGQLGAKVPREIQERIRAAQAQQGAQTRQKAGY